VRSGGTATVLITGAKGQLGRELLDTAPSAWRLIACGSGDLDVTDADAVNAVMERERPAAVIQLAAYTQVDQAETEAEQAAPVP
jgi:dTDP-4-dehydrorhamnose reductase